MITDLTRRTYKSKSRRISELANKYINWWSRLSQDGQLQFLHCLKEHVIEGIPEAHFIGEMMAEVRSLWQELMPLIEKEVMYE